MIYVEVFGAGVPSFSTRSAPSREVLNDANGNLINLYRVVREHPEELKDRLLYVLHNREDFKLAQRRLAQFSYKDDILRRRISTKSSAKATPATGSSSVPWPGVCGPGSRPSTESPAGSKASPWKKKISALSSKGTIRLQLSFTSTRPTFFTEDYYPGNSFSAVRSPAACDNSAECRGPLAAVLQPVPGGVGAVPAAWHLH